MNSAIRSLRPDAMGGAQSYTLDHIWRFMVSPMQAVNQVTGQKILFRGVDNPIKAKSINLRLRVYKGFLG